jgi:hypothetical protein
VPKALFEGAGFAVHTYPDFDRQRLSVNFDAMKTALASLPRRSIVLQQGGLILFLDMAYLGFGQGLHEDAHLLRALDRAGMPYLLSNAFSKTFSLYGEHVPGQLKATVRRNYSSPPALGADLVGMVLGDAARRQAWVSQGHSRVGSLGRCEQHACCRQDGAHVRVRTQAASGQSQTPSQVAPTQPGAFHLATIQPVPTHAQPRTGIPPVPQRQGRLRVGITPSVRSGLHLRGLRPTHVRKGLQQHRQHLGHLALDVCLTP